VYQTTRYTAEQPSHLFPLGFWHVGFSKNNLEITLGKKDQYPDERGSKPQKVQRFGCLDLLKDGIMRKKHETRFCVECGGELEPLDIQDNQNSHADLFICIRVLRGKLENVWDKIKGKSKKSSES